MRSWELQARCSRTPDLGTGPRARPRPAWLWPGWRVSYWTKNWGREQVRDQTSQLLCMEEGKRGRITNVPKRCGAMASCPNPVPHLPGHVQTDSTSQPSVMSSVATRPMEQADTDPWKPLTHNPSCSFPLCELVRSDMVSWGVMCCRWQSPPLEGTSVSE